MPVSITVNSSNVLARLQRIKSNVPKALEAVGQVYLIDASHRIANGDSSWPAWSPHYKPKRPHQMLWDTGTLLRSLTKGDSNNVWEQSGNTLVIGSNVKYAAAQQYGYSARNLPARPYLVIDNEDVNRKAALAFAKYLLK